jgi:hypothetical protein
MGKYNFASLKDFFKSFKNFFNFAPIDGGKDIRFRMGYVLSKSIVLVLTTI